MLDSARRLVRVRYEKLAERPRNLIGVSLTRIVYGFWLLSFYLQGLPVREFVWGRSSPLSFESFIHNLAASSGYSVLAFSDSPAFLTAMCAAGVILAATVTIGLFTRESLIASAVLLWSFHARNSAILDGGDNLGRIVLLFLVFMNCSSFLSVDAKLRLSRAPTQRQFILHNLALLATIVQLCAVYLTAGLSKLTGELWRNGTAMYYVLRSAEYSRFEWVADMASNLHLVTLASYAVIALQCSFIVFVWAARPRLVLVAALILLHLCIAYFMGLVRFSTVMCGTLLLLVPDDVYRSTWESLRHLVQRRSGHLQGVGPESSFEAGS